MWRLLLDELLGKNDIRIARIEREDGRDGSLPRELLPIDPLAPHRASSLSLLRSEEPRGSVRQVVRLVDVEQGSPRGIEREPRRLVDDRQPERIEEIVQRSSFLVEQRVGDLDRPHVNDARQRPVSVPILERDRLHRRRPRRAAARAALGSAGPACPRPRRGHELGPDGDNPACSPASGPRPSFGSRARPTCRGAWHRWFGGVGGEDDDHLGTDLAEPEHGVLEQRHPAVGLGQLVATEPRRAPAREDDARDLRQAGLPAVARAPGSARTGTRTAP